MGSLEKWLPQQPRPLADAVALNMLLGIASGVHHLHMEGIVHRDLAARNVMLGAGNVPKLTDFGLARQAPPGITMQTTSARTSHWPIKWMVRFVSHLTSPLTRFAQAPEQLRHAASSYSSSSDVYSFGVVCYEILAQAAPWPDISDDEAALRTLRGERLSLPP